MSFVWLQLIRMADLPVFDTKQEVDLILSSEGVSNRVFKMRVFCCCCCK